MNEGKKRWNAAVHSRVQFAQCTFTHTVRQMVQFSRQFASVADDESSHLWRRVTTEHGNQPQVSAQTAAVPPTDSAKPPEFVLWRMTKNGVAAEARTRAVRLGDGIPELRIYYTRVAGQFDLLWSATLNDGREVCELAQVKQREFEVKGWTFEPPTLDVGAESS